MDYVKLARSLAREVIAIRRDIHAHPELSFKEKRTAAVIEKKLKSCGVKTRRMAATGVCGYLDGAAPGPTIALRADIDALPLQEETRLPYRSRVPGIMHACGHDTHAAMLVGAAEALASVKDELRGSVRFIFQPGEELPPGGAVAMIADGAMKDVDEVYGAHIASEMRSGTFAADPGPAMANIDTIGVTIIGKGAHGANPASSVDPILTAAEAVMSLQQVVSRNVTAWEPAVVSICAIHAGDADNIIPESVKLRGTVRTYSKALRRRMPAMIRRVLDGVCRAHGARFKLDYESGYDVLVNDAAACEHVRAAVVELFGRKRLVVREPRMGGEDFSEYLKLRPGCFWSLGAGDAKKKTNTPHHSPHTMFDESVLWMGVAMHIKIVMDRTSG
jgi:amidohydrolase